MAGEDNSGGVPERGGAGGTAGLGAAPSDGGSLSESGAGGMPEPSAAGSGAGGTDTAAAGNAGAAGECSVVAWFPDADGDGFGRASGQVLSCDPPAVGKWAAKAGDCDDDNTAVFPKEPDFKAGSYTATSNGMSFDYDCSNKEESDPTQPAAPACGSLTILNCAGSGFANTARTGPGVNPLCGSKSFVTCTKNTLSCVAVTTMTTDGVRCR
jgi:hypothetical protein